MVSRTRRQRVCPAITTCPTEYHCQHDAMQCTIQCDDTSTPTKQVNQHFQSGALSACKSKSYNLLMFNKLFTDM